MVFFVIALKSRAVEITGIGVNPNGDWMKQMARNLTDRVDCRRRPEGVPFSPESPGTRYPPLLAHPATPGNGVKGRLRRRAKRACP